MLCGKDMTKVTYAQIKPDTARADTNVAHAPKALRISNEEAQRSDQESKRKLLASRKLSLVVDLDLTIIQATVDPTIGEWQDDPNNPNYEAIKDVRSFELRDDALNRNVAYYVKMRPGLLDFLDRVSKLFELHIYTMGTRNYALEIANIVDPTRKLFGDRILSRTETPGEDSKNLRKLFPVDTKMVVIIDDRQDVWRNSPYLVKVTPYNFFTGIGDIHGSFLDKRYEAENKAIEVAQPSAASSADAYGKPNPVTATTTDEKASDADDAALEQFVSMRNNADAGSLEEKTAAAEEALVAQLSDRPLLQQQKAIEKAEAEAGAGNTDGSVDEGSSSPPALRQSLLQDNDDELTKLGAALTEIHTRFYQDYEGNATGAVGRVAQLRNGSPSKKRRLEDDLLSVPDVKNIIYPIRSSRLRHQVVVFTGVVPIGVDIHRSRLGNWVQDLGGDIQENIDTLTTHLIAAPGRHTHKLRAAVKDPKIKITTVEWLQDQWQHWWKKVDEADYPVSDLPPPSERIAGPNADAAFEPGVDGVDLDDADEDPERGSPKPEFKAEEWDDIDAELNDYLEGDDSESEAGTATEGESDAEGDTGDAIDSRKRARSNTESDSDSEGTVRSRGFPDSKLQRRKRQALDRSSSLTNVLRAADTPNGQSSQQPAGMALREEEGDMDSYDSKDEDDDFDAALEAELEAELEASDEDD